MINRTITINKIFKVIIVEQVILVISVLIELYNVILVNGPEITKVLMESPLEYFSKRRIVFFGIVFNILYGIYCLAKFKKIKLGEKIYKYRYWICLIAFVLCVLFRVNRFFYCLLE